MAPGFLTHLSAAIKDAVRVPVGAVGRINDPLLAEEILKEGKADFINIGRALIADPEFPVKAFEGRLEEIRPCTGCNLGCNDRMYLQQDISCQTNPMAGRETYCRIKPTLQKKRVLIAGGGPAGLEAARVAALRGHEVFLYEKEKVLGGQLNLAAVAPGKVEYRKLVKYYEYQMKKLKVNVIHKEANKEEIRKIKPEVIIFATGGKPQTGEKIIRVGSESVVMAWDVLKGKKLRGDEVVIIGGGQIGCETAEYLLGQDKKITILEMLEIVAADMSKRTRQIVLDKLIRGGVEIIKQAVVKEISDSEVRYERGGLKEKIEKFDHVVISMGTVSERSLLDEVGDINIPTFSIGDCISPRRALEAIREGFDIALEI